jgi:outer membrane protein OmpA-like peptidoglycan-associated protein
MVGALILIPSYDLDAQFLKKLGKKMEEAAKRKVEQKAEQKTEEAVGNAIDNITDPDSYKQKQEQNVQQEQQKQTKQATTPAPASAAEGEEAAPAAEIQKDPEMAYRNFDFVAGDEIIFDDDVAGEQIGEFPSKWDLIEGEAEIAKMNGENVIVMKQGAKIRPLMKDIYNYLGDVFTIEFDYWFTYQKESEYHGTYWLYLTSPKQKWYQSNNFYTRLPGFLRHWDKEREDGKVGFSYWWNTTSNESRSGDRDVLLETGKWVHISLSFNKRAMKIYVNETRIANIPNMTNDIGWMTLTYGGGDDHRSGYIRNIRIAKGAVPLYDRMMTDGKIISYGITFDVGKATLKPESLGEINRIVSLMNENPTIKFSVEGHTDNTGKADANLKLSQSRSQAVVDKMMELGIAADRLTATGKGQANPISDNTTDEGRAKNRRVEFVKQ